MIKNPGDFKLGGGLTVFCLFLLVYLIPNQVGPLTDADALMPLIMTVIILVLSLALVLKSMRLPAAPGAAHHGPSRTMMIGVVTGIMVVYAWLLESLGFLLISFVGMVSLFLVFGVRDYKKILFITVPTLTILYVAFEKFFNAPLPVGTLVEKLLD